MDDIGTCWSCLSVVACGFQRSAYSTPPWWKMMRMRWLVALERAQPSALSLPLVPWSRTGQAPGLTVLPLPSDWLQAHILLLAVGITPRPLTPPPRSPMQVLPPSYCTVYTWAWWNILVKSSDAGKSECSSHAQPHPPAPHRRRGCQPDRAFSCPVALAPHSGRVAARGTAVSHCCLPAGRQCQTRKC